MASAPLFSAAPLKRTPAHAMNALIKRTTNPSGILGIDFLRINFTGFGAVGRSHDAIPFHLLHHPSSAVVSYPQSSLNHRDRSLLGFRNDRDGLIVHFVVFVVSCRGRFDFSLGFKDFR